KLAASGAAVASVGFGPNGRGRPVADAVAIGPSGSVIVGGRFNAGTMTFDAAASIALTPAGIDGFVARFDADLGHTPWARRIGDPPGASDPPKEQRVVALAVGGQGDVVAVGDFVGATDFGLGSPTAPPDGNSDAFAVKLDGATGAAKWVRTTKGVADETASGVAVDAHDGSVWVTGTFISNTTPPIANWGTTPATELVFSLDTNSRHSYLVHLAP